MILFPPAKINLGLNILFKREDGYHELDTCMLPIPLVDVLEILPAAEFTFHQSGIKLPDIEEDNICVKAYHLMHENYSIPPVYMHLRKEIPIGAGLGGGSSDAAYVLKGLNTLFTLNCTETTLEDLASKLGSDCPFFIKNEAQIAGGRGEILTKINLNLSSYCIKVVNPGIHISTKDAYAGIVLGSHLKSVKQIVEGPIENWKHDLQNDFEVSVFKIHPLLAEIKEKMYGEGAIYASMSGSGSTMFGLYQAEPKRSFGDLKSAMEIIKML